MTPARGHYWLRHSVEELVDAAIGTRNFDAQPIARLAPFMDWMGVWPSGTRKEFWWEREWRHVGNFTLPDTYIALCPEEEQWMVDAFIDQLEVDDPPKVRFVDPAWSLEMIIGSLAGFGADELGPF